MNIIISHDVDNLYRRDHWFRDLTYPKLWIRESLNVLKGDVSLKEWLLRCISCFKKKRNYIPEILQFDKEHGIHSTFFFGMNQGLGMSYKPEEAVGMIQYVINQGLDVGVHGICFDDYAGIEKEKQQFIKTVGVEPVGIRMHYVRHNKETFEMLDKSGYLFDSTEFDKKKGICVKPPYRIGSMWEFPVCLMDSYLPYDLERAKKITLEALEQAEKNNLEYFTILFHDPHFGKEYNLYYLWYLWLVSLIEKRKINVISFETALRQLNERAHKEPII